MTELSMLPALETIYRKCQSIRIDVASVLLVLVVARITYLDALSQSNVDPAECLAMAGARFSRDDALGLHWIASNGLRLEEGGILETVPRCESLETLSLSRSTFDSYQLSNLAGLKRLRSLSLRDSNLDDEGLSLLGDCGSLQVLSLDGTGVTSHGVSHVADLPMLRYLSLARSRVDDRCIKFLANIGSLEEVDLRSTNVTRDGVRRLEELTPNCRIVSDLPCTQGTKP